MLLVFDLYMSYLLLRLTAGLTHTRLRFRRAILGAAVGSMTSLLVLLPPMPFLLTMFCKLTSAVLLCLAAFGIRDRRLFIWHVLCFLGLSCILAGMLLALTATGNVCYANGCWYPVISLRMLVLCTAGAYAVLTLIARIRERMGASDDTFEVVIRYGAQTICLEGLADTGNSLTDFCTGKPVIVCSREALGGLVPEQPCRGFRPLPYSTAAGDGLLTVFTPDETVIRSKRTGAVKAVDVLIGADGQSHRQAIFHPRILH